MSGHKGFARTCYKETTGNNPFPSPHFYHKRKNILQGYHTIPYMRVKKFFSGFCLLTLSITCSWGESYKDMIRRDRGTASGEYYHYIYKTSPISAPPKGYKPFFISHYGRHGSRYHTDSRYMDQAIAPLLKADSLHILTPEGKALLKDLQSLLSMHKGHFGMLSELGINEQQDIARRMYGNFPEVFNGKRHHILCSSSLYPRCLASMANFMSSLQQNASGMIARMYCSDELQKKIAPNTDMTETYRRENLIEDSLRKAICPPDSSFKRWLTIPQKGWELTDNPYLWMKNIINAGSVVYNLDNAPDILKYFTTAELESLWVARNMRFHYCFAMSTESPESTRNLCINVIREIIQETDSLLADTSQVAAHFRFGHDTIVLPLGAYIGIEGLDGRYSALQAENNFNCTESVCMATNLQLVFYKNKKGDILVKCLYNESERHIPALGSQEGFYYKWKDLREYLKSLL